MFQCSQKRRPVIIHYFYRYQTEGSRGAIKDRSGSSYPSIKLDGYNKSAKIQIFIGSDSGKANPHLFYQVQRCKMGFWEFKVI